MEINRVVLTQFIKCYQKNACLWDPTHVHYKNHFKRQASYRELLEIFKIQKQDGTIEDVKRKVNAIRTTYRREMRKIENSKRNSSEDKIYKPSLWYFKSIEFLSLIEKPLAKVIRENKHDTSEDEYFNKENNMSEIESEQQEQFSEIYFDGEIKEQPKSDQEEDVEIYDFQPNSSIVCESESEQEEKHIPKHEVRKKSKRDKLIYLACKYLSKEDDDEYLNIAKVWGQKLKKLNSQKRLQIEKTINDIFFKAELENIQLKYENESFLSPSQSMSSL